MCKLEKEKYIFTKTILLMLIGGFLYMNIHFVTIAAERDSCGSKLTWSLSGATLTISGSGNMENFQDETLAPWYDSAENIRTVILPDGLTSIGDLAFYGCTNLTSIQIPNSVTTIGEYAFAECTSLLQVDLGSELQTIESGAFYQCESLSAVSLPASLTNIGSKAFYRCNGLSSITIPETVTFMGSETFAYCEGLVRATVNAPIKKLPDWTFYGCSSLSDVSLASSITTVGEYAFQDCENLNGIYTQSGSDDTAYEIEQSISRDEDSNVNGFVGSYDMPESSFVAKDDGLVYTETKVTQKENVTITTKTETDYSYGNGAKNIIIEAAVNDSASWNEVLEATEEVINGGNSSSIMLEIQLTGDTVEASELAKFAGRFVTLRIITSNGVIWQIDMSEMSEEYFTGTYHLGTVLEKDEDKKNKIASDTVYHLNFVGKVNFNVTVGIKLDSSHKLATLYEKKGSSYEIISTMMMDHEDYAWFSLAGVDKNAEYFIGMDVEKISTENAVIPETMYEQYDIGEDSTLMDSDGVRYRITGRSSRWGITLGQFMSYVVVAMLAIVLIVAVVMITMNILKRSREKYERMAEEDALREKEEEEALRMEIMKELLGEKKN